MRKDNNFPRVRELIFRRGPISREQVQTALKLSPSIAKKHIAKLRGAEVIHVAAWTRDATGRNLVALWGWGHAADAPVPVPEPKPAVRVKDTLTPLLAALPGNAAQLAARLSVSEDAVRRYLKQHREVVHIGEWTREGSKRPRAVYHAGVGRDVPQPSYMRPKRIRTRVVIERVPKPVRLKCERIPKGSPFRDTPRELPAHLRGDYVFRSVFAGGVNPWIGA